jgi:hypothetical protein
VRNEIAFILALLVGPAAFCLAPADDGKRPAPGGEHRLVGEVVSIDAVDRLMRVKETLKGGSSKEIAFVIAADAKVRVRGREAALADVAPGDSVTVTYVEQDGRKIARSCDVAKPVDKRSSLSPARPAGRSQSPDISA